MHYRGSLKQKNMFRKIVSNLNFSPALVGQLAFYAHRLKKEEATRRLGLIFVALALVVQSLAVFNPPESANATSGNDLVDGGLGLGSARSLNNFLVPYDNNTRNLRYIMNSFGITREEITNTQFGKFRTPGKIGWGHWERAGQTGSVTIYDDNWNPVQNLYGRPLTYNNGVTDIWGYIGHSKKVGWFAIMQWCGNLVTDYVPESLTPPKPADVELSKTATNLTQGHVDATKKTAKSGDRITFNLKAENKGGMPTTITFKDDLNDVLQYATVADTGGGIFDKDAKILTWPEVTINAGEKISRTFSVKVLNTIPTTPTGQSDPESYDCKMENKFGSDVVIKVDCSTPKVLEAVVTELPHTGPAENMVFGAVVLAIVTYFYFRSRQLAKETRLIRRNLNTGAL